VAPAEAVEQLPSYAAADVDKLSRLAERLAVARRAREAEMEARFAEQRTQQEAARRWVEKKLETKRAEPEPAPATKAVAPAAASESAVEHAAPAPVAAGAALAATLAPVPTPAASRRHPRPSIRSRRSHPVTPVIGPAAPPVAAAPVAPADALARGQAALSGQDYEAAVLHLSVLVEQGQHLDTVVQSLESAVGAARPPVPVLRLLGDAYMRTDQLQKALDAYRQALGRL
jgi:tetratricopeptide (TPR) repeat protein